MTNKLQQNYPQFFELNGTALNDGYIYIGVDGLDPTTNPIPIYLNVNLTTPISQPLRTTGGYVYYNGNPVSIYFGDSNYSITVENSLNNLIYTNLSAHTIPSANTSIIVENISSLKTFNVNEANQVEVLGYYTKGDGGGGLFYWDNTSTETDNGGTVIQATGITTGRWKRVFSGAVNIKWFGAKGDWNRGTLTGTDDTVAIQSALNAVPYGGSVKFPSGEYLISSTVTVSRWCEIYGEGLPFAIQGVQIHTENPDITMMRVQTETVNIHHIGFRGAGRDVGVGNGIALYVTRNSGDTSTSNDQRFDMLWFNGFNNTGFLTTKIQGAHLTNCTFEFCASGIKCTDTIFIQNIISQSRFYACFKAINLSSISAVSLNATEVKWNIISDCIFDFNSQADQPSQGAIFLGDNATANIIDACQFNNNRAHDIYLLNNIDNSITNCKFNRSARSAIYASNSDRLIISNTNITSANYLLSTHLTNHSAITIINTVDAKFNNINIFSFSGEYRIDYGIKATNNSVIELNQYSVEGTTVGTLYQDSGSDINVTSSLKGTFTPFAYGSATAGTNIYSRQNGFYTLHDNRVEFNISLTIATWDSLLAGNIRIGGLPFISSSVTDKYIVNCDVLGTANKINVGGYIALSNDFIRLFETDGDTYALLGQTDFKNGTQIVISGSYLI